MLLGAGYGTRLRPISMYVPKILLPVLDRPLLVNTVRYLKRHGVVRIALNTHHLARPVSDFIGDGRRFDTEIYTKHEPTIMGTGGGVRGLGSFISDDHFVIYNGDIVTNIDIGPALETHRARKRLVTMILHDHKRFNKVAVDTDERVIDIEGRLGKTADAARVLAFTGIAIAQRELLEKLPPHGFCDLKDVYLSLAASPGQITAYVAGGHYWRDIGTVDDYLALHRDVLVGRHDILVDYELPEGPVFVGRNSFVSEAATLTGFVSIGHDSRVEAATLEDSVVFSRTLIRSGDRFVNSVVGPDWQSKGSP